MFLVFEISILIIIYKDTKLQIVIIFKYSFFVYDFFFTNLIIKYNF